MQKATQGILNYNIHNILSFQINRKKCKDIIRDMNLPYSSFEIEHIEEPDIILNLGDFSPSNENCYIIDHKWHVKSDYIYCSERIGGIRFNIEIIGLDSKPTTINVSNNFRKFRQLILPSVLPQHIALRGLIDYKLLNKGYISVHAAAIANEGGAIIFLGRGGTFKTTLSMDYVRNLGYKFLGDDTVIVNKNDVLSYTVHSGMFEYRANKIQTEDYSRLHKFKYLLYQRSKDRVSEYTVDDSKISSTYLIAKSSGKEMRAERLSKEDVLAKTVISNRLENIRGLSVMNVSKGLYDYFTAYSYIFPHSKIACYWDTYRSILSESLDNNEYYEIFLPRKYRGNTFQDFIELTRSLER